MPCRRTILALMLCVVAGGPARSRADAELGHIYCLSARAAIQAKDYDRAREQLKQALQADPASTEAILLQGDLARDEGRDEEARKHYAACAKALLAKRPWTQRDLDLRADLSERLLAPDDEKALAEAVRNHADRWLAVARGLARDGAQAAAQAAVDLAAALDPDAARKATVTEYAGDRGGWSPLVTDATLKDWRQLRGTWRSEGGALASQGAEALIAAPAGNTTRDLRIEVEAAGKAVLRVDLASFSAHLDFGARRARAASQFPGAAFTAPLKDAPRHTLAFIHRRVGLETMLDGDRLGLFPAQKAEGLVGVQVTGGDVKIRSLDTRPPQAEPEAPEEPDWREDLPPRRRRPEPPKATSPDDLLSVGRSLEAILKLAEKREPMIADILALSSALEERGLRTWAAEVCDAGLKRGFIGELVAKLTLHRAHLASALGDAAAALKLAQETKDESESTLVLLGDALKRQGKTPEAVAAWQKALKLNPLRDDVVGRLTAAGAQAARAAEPLAPERAVELLKPTVAVIAGAYGGGSGFFLTPDGVMLTNNHVIANVLAPRVVAIFRDGAKEQRETLPITAVLATDPTLDLAIVRVAPRGLRFTPVRLAEGGLPKLGSKVLVIGSPGFGELRLDYTVTQGIVSSDLRSLHGARYVQTDAAINPGNSGGPVFNERGEVIGVATAGILFAQNVGFFVPSTLVRDYLKRENLP
ncbi:MAG: trypsin-like serine protease [Planctomycetes bacterium]|nr:trypsin-like serine protease [Planctomycetota bacterium]